MQKQQEAPGCLLPQCAGVMFGGLRRDGFWLINRLRDDIHVLGRVEHVVQIVFVATQAIDNLATVSDLQLDFNFRVTLTEGAEHTR